MKIGEKVFVKDVVEMSKDRMLEPLALDIIVASKFTGVITSVSGGIYYVGFYNDLGWVTQGYMKDEIEVVLE